jgi:hypothetical protein
MFLLISLIVFSTLTYRSQITIDTIKELRDTIYEVWENEDESSRGKTEEFNFALKDQNIWGHTHRMYLIGFNSIRYPWQIPKDFPRDAL